MMALLWIRQQSKIVSSIIQVIFCMVIKDSSGFCHKFDIAYVVKRAEHQHAFEYFANVAE